MSEQVPAATSDAGKSSAVAVYVLYLLTLPSAGVLVLVGLVWAYVARAEAAGWVRTHFDQQIRIFWVTTCWMIGVGLLALAGLWLVLVLVGVPILMIAALLFVAVSAWFYLKSILGLIALVQGKPA